MEFGLGDPPTTFQEHNSDTIAGLFDSESDHMPLKSSQTRLRNRDCYISFRSEAISLILQAQFSCNFEPFISYLAVNYLDRYVSKQDIPLGKPWISRLLVIACLSLAAKMKNLPLPLSDIQREEGGFAFDSPTVRKMEVLILDSLSWRMRSVTPFSFLSFFVSPFELSDSDARALRDRASAIIFASQTDPKFLEYKPSIIAASAILSACHELFPSRFPCFEASFSACEYVKSESLWKCYNVMQEMVANNMDSNVAMSSMGITPMSVLERKFTDSEISDNNCKNATTNSTGQKYCDKEENKRRRYSGLCSGGGGNGNSSTNDNSGSKISQFSPY